MDLKMKITLRALDHLQVRFIASNSRTNIAKVEWTQKVFINRKQCCHQGISLAFTWPSLETKRANLRFFPNFLLTNLCWMNTLKTTMGKFKKCQRLMSEKWTRNCKRITRTTRRKVSWTLTTSWKTISMPFHKSLNIGLWINYYWRTKLS